MLENNIARFNKAFPWEIIPELNYMEKNLTYEDIYKTIAFLMRSPIKFYNYFENRTYNKLFLIFYKN